MLLSFRRLSLFVAAVVIVGACGKGLLPLGSSGSLQISNGGIHGFGAVISQHSATATFTLTNPGSQPVTGLGGTRASRGVNFGFLGGAYPGTGGTCATMLAGGASCTIVAAFVPPRSGSYSESLTLSYDPGQTALLTLSGDGLGGGADQSFGTSGIATISIGVSPAGTGMQNLQIQSDGKVVVSDTIVGAGLDISTGVSRFNSNGTIDTTYGFGGTNTISIGSGIILEYPFASLLQPDGKYVVSGRRNLDTMFVFRLTTQGLLDATFGTGGIMTDAATNSDWGNYIALAQDNRIWVVSNRIGVGGTLIRYTTSGAFDTSFDTDGILIPALGAGNSVGAVLVQPDDKFVVAGSRSDGSGSFEGFIARFLTDGSFDPSFDTDGIVSLDMGVGSDAFFALAQTPSGELVAAGIASVGTTQALVARYLSNGAPDTSFSGDGIATVSLGTTDGGVKSIGLLSDGKTIFIDNLAMFRLSTDGSLDSTFGTGGIHSDYGGLELPRRIVVDPQGRTLVVGYDTNDAVGLIRVMP